MNTKQLHTNIIVTMLCGLNLVISGIDTNQQFEWESFSQCPLLFEYCSKNKSEECFFLKNYSQMFLELENMQNQFNLTTYITDHNGIIAFDMQEYQNAISQAHEEMIKKYPVKNDKSIIADFFIYKDILNPNHVITKEIKNEFILIFNKLVPLLLNQPHEQQAAYEKIRDLEKNFEKRIWP